MNERYVSEEDYESREKQKKIERIAEELLDATEFNAWEYGNTGNFLYN